LPERNRSRAFQSLNHFTGQTAETIEVQIDRNSQPIVAMQTFDRKPLTVDITGI